MTQRACLATLVVAFYATAILWSDHTLSLVVPGTVAFVAAWWRSRRLGYDATGGREMVGVFLASMFVVALPSAATPPLGLSTAVPIALGILSSEGIWAVHRFPVTQTPKQPIGRSVAQGVAMGLSMAAVYSFIALVILALAALGGEAARRQLAPLFPGVFLAYIGGGLAAGTVVGLLRRLTGAPLATMFVGIIVGTLVYGAMAPVVAAVEANSRGPMSVGEQVFAALMCGVLAGPPGALMWKYDDPDVVSSQGHG
jgi:hypothetical protein